MGYPEKLLSDGERIEMEMRPHWRALLVPGLVLLGIIVGLFILFSLLGGNNDFFENGRGFFIKLFLFGV